MDARQLGPASVQLPRRLRREPGPGAGESRSCPADGPTPVDARAPRRRFPNGRTTTLASPPTHATKSRDDIHETFLNLPAYRRPGADSTVAQFVGNF